MVDVGTSIGWSILSCIKLPYMDRFLIRIIQFLIRYILIRENKKAINFHFTKPLSEKTKLDLNGGISSKMTKNPYQFFKIRNERSGRGEF